MKIVLTGGPCSGKSSLVKRILEKGFNIVPETAKEVIDEWGNVEDKYSFQLEIAKRQFEKEKKINGLTFLDRGLFDGYYYSKRYLGYIPKKILDLGKFTHYDYVFMLDRLPFKNEGFRLESNQNDAEDAHKGIIEIYNELGYSPVSIPVMPLEERYEFIIDFLKNMRSYGESCSC